MTDGLLLPEDAADDLNAKIRRVVGDAVIAESAGEEFVISVRLRPGISKRSVWESLPVGLDDKFAWLDEWAKIEAEGLPDGITVERSAIAGVAMEPAPRELRCKSVGAALRFIDAHGDGWWTAELLDRARAASRKLAQAGGLVSGRNIRDLALLENTDQKIALEMTRWLADHPDISGSTLTQFAAPAAHTKWVRKHSALVDRLTGRTIRDEAKPRAVVVQFTYLDPDYRAQSGARIHDSWTVGDKTNLPYQPKVIVIVENRDARTEFPPMHGGIAIEGGGDAASLYMPKIPWLRGAKRVVYWGDIDADGYAILSALRASFAEFDPPVALESILMDAATLREFASLAALTDRDGNPLGPTSNRLKHLTDGEQEAYDIIASRADGVKNPVRRIEQEKLPRERAALLLESPLPPR